MSALLELIGGGAKALIGMVQLQPLPGSSRYAGAPPAAVLTDALAQAELLRAAGFPIVMVQNLGDLPVTTTASPVQVAWMTRIVAEIRRATQMPVGINLLENDVEAMFAVASAADADFVRIKVFIGAMVTPSGVENGRAFEAQRARTAWQAQRVAIVADVHDRTGMPLASAGIGDDVRTAFAIGGADGVVLTGRSHQETLDFLATARDGFPDRPMLVGGGASAETITDLLALADGAIVSSALKPANDLFGKLDPEKARAFIRAARG